MHFKIVPTPFNIITAEYLHDEKLKKNTALSVNNNHNINNINNDLSNLPDHS